MTEKFVNLPDDSTNTGKKMRTIENTINAVVVEQEPVMLTDQTGADLSANIANLNITLSALRDAIVGAGPKTLTDIVTAVTANTKPADVQHVTVDTITPLVALDASVNALLKPASTLTGVTTVGAVTAITNPLPAGTNTLGKVDQGAGGASAWKVDGTGGAFPVSGSVGVNNFPATQPTTNVNQDASYAAPNATAPALVQAVAGSDGVILRPFPVTATGVRLEIGDPIHLELQKISAGIQLLVGALVGNIALEDVV